METLLCEIRCQIDETRQSPGRLVGELLTYERRAKDRPEIFTRGALTFPDDGLTITLLHERNQPLLRTMPFVDGDRVLIDAPLPDTTRGRDVATDMRQERPLYGGLSIEFASRAEGRRGNLREIRSAFAPFASLVLSASHDTRVEVRHQSGLALPEDVYLWL